MSDATNLAQSVGIAGKNGPAGAEVVVPDNMLYEIVEGQILEKPVGAKQVQIAFMLAYRIESFAEPKRLGHAITEMIFRIDPAKDLQRRPDAAFISDVRWPFRRRVPDVPVWDLVPDLAIEVVSLSNSADAVNDKMREYFEAGSSQVWVVYPKRSEIYVYSSTKQIQVSQLGDELDGGDLLPGFRLPVAALFEDEPETE